MVADRLSAIRDEHGPDAIALYVSGQMSIEAQYLANKLAKGYLRTQWIESNSRLCMASAGTGYKQSLGADGPPGSYDDLDTADLFVVLGANMADCHPILYLRMMDRVREGAKLVVVDPRRTATAAKADVYLPVRPGTDLALLNGLLRLVRDAGGVDDEFVAAYTEGWEPLDALLDDYPRGSGRRDHRRRRSRPARGGRAHLRDEEVDEPVDHGAQPVHPWDLEHQRAVQPSPRDRRDLPPGRGPVLVDRPAERDGRAGNGLHGPGSARTALGPGPRPTVHSSRTVGGSSTGTIRSRGRQRHHRHVPADGRRRDPRGVDHLHQPCCFRGESGLGDRGPAARRAGGGAGRLHRCGDRRIRRRGAAGRAVGRGRRRDGQQRTNADALRTRDASTRRGAAGLAADLPGRDRHGIFRVSSSIPPLTVFDELAGFHNSRTGWDLRGVNYERLRRSPVQWPAAPGCTDRNPIRYVNDGVSQDLHTAADGSVPALAFPTPSRRARFLPRPHLPAAELPDDEFPLVFTTGRLAHQWHTMTKTGKVAKLNKLNPEPFLQLHPEDAERLGVSEGDRVEIRSRRGRAVLPAAIDDAVRPGVCFAPMHWADAFGADLAVNAVTNDAVDADSLQPEFKVCAVALTPIETDPAATQPPLTEGPGSGGGARGAAAARCPRQRPSGSTNDCSCPVCSRAFAPIRPQGRYRCFPRSPRCRAENRAWVDGVLAGIFSRTEQPVVASPARAVKPHPKRAPPWCGRRKPGPLRNTRTPAPNS